MNSQKKINQETYSRPWSPITTGMGIVYYTRWQQGRSCNIPVSRTFTKKLASLAGNCGGGFLNPVGIENQCQLIIKREKHVGFEWKKCNTEQVKRVIVMDVVRNVKAEKRLSREHTWYHGQTECDTIASFSGISKIKTRWKQYLEAQKLLQSLGRSLSLVLHVLQLRWKQKM